MKNKIRIYKLASNLELSTKEIITVAQELGINVNSGLATVGDVDQDALIDYFQQKNSLKHLQTKVKLPFKIRTKTLDVKNKVSEFQNGKITIDVNNKIRELFQKIKTTKDLLDLVNAVNKYIYGKKHTNFKMKQFTYYAYHSIDKYTIFNIPKKSGGTREIYAPKKGLKNILNILNVLFQSTYKPHMSSHGFTRHRSVATNAKYHTGKNYVYNIDLKNFFPSIHQARIWKRLLYPPYNLTQDVTNMISNLVCYQYRDQSEKRNFLPQGAPTSPVLSNIICERLDKKLFQLAKTNNVKYTRYADDMTFSSDYNVYQDNSDFLNKLHKIIEEENFVLNDKKTRLQKRGYRQEVTGVIVNEKLNLSKRYIKNLRALIYLVSKYEEKKAQKIFGEKNSNKILQLVIQGKLQYLKMVKGKEDSTYKTLYKKYTDAYKLVEVQIVDKNNNETKKLIVKAHKNTECEHNPRELVEILKKFSQNGTAFKAAVHSEAEYHEFDGYDDFIQNLHSEWVEINPKLKKLSKRLHGKIYAFLFKDTLGNSEKDTWGDFKMTFGWSSPKLREWCNNTSQNINGNSPFSCSLDDKDIKKVNNQTISSFGNICRKVFKYEIEIRPDKNMRQLHNIFTKIKKELYEEGFTLSLDKQLKELDNYYTDTHWLEQGIKTIFSEIKTRDNYKDINVTVLNKDDLSCEIRIVHKGSKADRESSNLIKESNDGDFGTIKERLCSLCDWSIEAKCTDGNYRINYLKSEDVQESEKLNYEPEGFTHVLRFYK